MSSSSACARAPTLLTLPPELLLSIITHLPLPDRMILRSVSKLFNDFIPRPTHQQLLSSAAETALWAYSKFFTCGGCVRLRHKRHFSFSKRYYLFDMDPGGEKADERFCNDCGVRDLTVGLDGEFRYDIGEVWEQGVYGVNWTRCERCERAGIMPCVRKSGLCQVCFETEEASKRRAGQSENVTPQPAFLINLPSKILANIVAKLELEERMLLRGVSRIFFGSIPRPMHTELLVLETKDWARHKIFACGGCVRLRHDDAFDTDNTSKYLNREQGGQNAHERFCRDCGIRDLPGPFRYGLGDTWNDEYFEGKWWVRCHDCGRIEEIRYDAIDCRGDDDVCEACDVLGRRN